MRKGFTYISFLLLVSALSLVIMGLGNVVLRQREICQMDRNSLQAYYMGIGGAEYYLVNKNLNLPLVKEFENCGFKISEIKGKILVEGFKGLAKNPDSIRRFNIEKDKIKPCVE